MERTDLILFLDDANGCHFRESCLATCVTFAGIYRAMKDQCAGSCFPGWFGKFKHSPNVFNKFIYNNIYNLRDKYFMLNNNLLPFVLCIYAYLF